MRTAPFKREGRNISFCIEINRKSIPLIRNE